MPNYITIGGHAYQPGSAAAKKAQELYTQWLREQAATQASQTAASQVPFPSVPNPAITTGTATSGGGTVSTSKAIPGTLTPAPATSGVGAYGLVPRVPDPVATAATAIGGNQANLPGLAKLGTDTTTLSANLAAQPYQMNLPNYQGLLGQASQNITSNLAGVIDPNEWAQLQQHAAERGAGMGISPASPNFSTALIKALDQSIVGRQSLGQQQFNAAVARTPTGQSFNVAGYQLSPQDVQAAQYAANVAGAAPDPTLAAQANLDALLKSIEAGRQGALGGTGGGGGSPGLPRVTAPGVSLPAGYTGYNSTFPNYTGYAPQATPTAPGTVPAPISGPYYGESPPADPYAGTQQDYNFWNQFYEYAQPQANEPVYDPYAGTQADYNFWNDYYGYGG